MGKSTNGRKRANKPGNDSTGTQVMYHVVMIGRFREKYKNKGEREQAIRLVFC
jgi:hypothetical protein